MTKSRTKAASSSKKSLVIVESPAKARTISRLLGSDFTVEASIGHIRDLPSGKKDMPAELKSQPWARLGVNVDDRFQPVYIVPADKKSQVAKLKKMLKDAKDLFLATDEDREGEAISWHLKEVLQPKVPVRRLVFHEITREAIKNALATPREIDDGLVRAQETRRILDRLYGFEMSEFLWKKSLGRSAGRVQSVAVRLLVERERERMRFRSATYWDLVARFVTEAGAEFDAQLVSVGGRRIPTGKDFDPATGRATTTELLVLDEAAANELAERLRRSDCRVLDLDVRPYSRSPAAPFTTSTMQQEANRKLGFTARRTMSTAQSLYENGHITYMRTDSTNLANEAIEAARELVRSEYGEPYLTPTPRLYKSKVKNAQEAHEAIRPAGHPFELPSALQGELSGDEFRLFELIWKRTIASQMSDARGQSVVIKVAVGDAIFEARGKTIEFPGFLRAYVEGSDDPDAEIADQETVLPTLHKDQPLRAPSITPKSHQTQPPPRYSEAALTRELERRGIGRPSTYASIIETIQAREYVTKKGGALVPTWPAMAMVRMLEEHFANLVDYDFTAQMEDLLDEISRNEKDHQEYLHDFYFGTDHRGLRDKLDAKIKEVDARAICTFPLGQPPDGEAIQLRVGRYGPYLEQGSRTATVPADLAPDELTLDRSIELVNQAQVTDEPLGVCPDTGKPVYIKQGRFGPYVQLGSTDDSEKPKNASLLPGMNPTEVTLEVALQLLSLPRTLGTHPQTGEVVTAHHGKYGPFIRSGDDTRSLPDGQSPLDVTLDQAVALLAQPKTRRGARRASAEPLKVFEPSPVTGQPVRLLSGRFGPYVTDGVTNASLPKDLAPEELTATAALDLLARRAAAGPAKRGRAPRRGSTPRKSSGRGRSSKK